MHHIVVHEADEGKLCSVQFLRHPGRSPQFCRTVPRSDPPQLCHLRTVEGSAFRRNSIWAVRAWEFHLKMTMAPWVAVHTVFRNRHFTIFRRSVTRA